MATLSSITIMITGADGFVGANLCRYFSERGAQVIALEGPSGLGKWRLDSVQSFRRIPQDICDGPGVKRLIEELQPSVIINCAAYGAYSSQTDADRIYRVNFDAVRSLLEAVRGVQGFRAFIQAGSSSEYGRNCSAPSEDSHTVPDSHYSVSKIAATALVQHYGKTLGVPAWSVRIYSAYGPFEEISRLIPKLILSAQEKKLPPLVNPRISRDFIYIDDLSCAFERLIERAPELQKGGIYNVGTGVKTTLEDLIELARSTFSIGGEPVWGSMPDRHWDHPDWYADPSKAKRELGWEPKFTFRQGLEATMKWFKEHANLIEAARAHSVLAAQGARR